MQAEDFQSLNFPLGSKKEACMGFLVSLSRQEAKEK